MFISFSFRYWKYPFILSIFLFLQILFGSKLVMKNNIIIPIINSFSYLFAIIPHSIIQHQNYSNSQKSLLLKEIIISSNQSKKRLGTISSFTCELRPNKIPKRRHLFYILLGFVDIIPHSLYIFYTLFEESEYSSIQYFLCILTTSILGHWLLKTSLFRHHYFSLGILLVNIIIYCSFSFNQLSKLIEQLNGWALFIILLIIYCFSSSLREVLEKTIMQNYFGTSTMILFVEGLFSFGAFVIYLIIIQWIPCKNVGILSDTCKYSQWDIYVKQELIDYFNYSSLNTLYAWLYIIFCFGTNFFRVETNKMLSPTHRYVAYMSAQLYWFIFKIGKLLYDGKFDLIKALIMLSQIVILIIICFIFNEYILIRVCSLDQFTYVEMMKRSLDEKQDIMILQIDEENVKADTNVNNSSNIINKSEYFI